MNINNFFFLIIVCTEFFIINCYFEDSPYIIDFKTIEEYENAIKENKLKYGFMLIYSPSCVHCRNFIPNYIQLSELFHNQLFFFALERSTNYKKYFQITGYPSIFFYSNKTFNKVEGSRSVQVLSQLIRKHASFNCAEISYTNLDLVYMDVYKKTDRNLVVGYFAPDSKYINSFISITNKLIGNYIDVCYYCANYKLINNKNLTENKYKKLPIFQNSAINGIKAFTKNKIENNFLFNDTEELDDNEYNYENFLFNHVINLYEDINDKEMIYLLERMKNKDFIFFVYDNNETKEKFINDINMLNNITVNKNENLYYYILLNKKINLEKFSSFEKDKIYLVSNNLISNKEINDLDIIKNNILENNLQNKNEEIIDNIKKYPNIIDNNDNNYFIDSHYINNNLDNISDIINNKFKNISNENIENDNIIKINYDKIKINKSNNQENEIKIKDISNEPGDNDADENKITKKPINLKYTVIIISIIFLIIYIVMKKFLCVGFIKVYEDYKVVEMGQSNKLEII